MSKLLKAVLIATVAVILVACGKAENAKNSQEGKIEGEPISKEASANDDATADETVTAPDFSGTYTEPMSGRCTITIESLGENNYKVSVLWGSSAFESANWEMNATYYDSTTLLEYTGAKYFVRTYSDEENYEDDVQYTDGAGEFWFEEDGKLGWRSANSDVDGVTGETFFEKVEIITE